jgi:hypothetical protein
MMLSSNTHRASLGLLLLAFACGFLSGFSWQGMWGSLPMVQENALYSLDAEGRLTRVAGRRPVACPAQRAGDVVLLAIGQSNAANALGERNRSRHPGQVLSTYAGQCYEAESPLIGTTGISGEFWTEVGNLLVERGAPHVVILPMAVGATEIAKWQAEGKLGRQLVAALKVARYRPTAVAWMQGESDFQMSTPAAQYRASFESLAGALRKAGVTAPIHVGVVSLCENGSAEAWTPHNPIAETQRALPDGKHVLPGPDTDTAIPLADRMDGCHFSGRGSAKAAQLWADALMPAG